MSARRTSMLSATLPSSSAFRKSAKAALERSHFISLPLPNSSTPSWLDLLGFCFKLLYRISVRSPGNCDRGDGTEHGAENLYAITVIYSHRNRSADELCVKVQFVFASI